MRLLLVSPRAQIQTGNKSTSEDWAGQLAALGHSPVVHSEYRGESADALIALHAAKSHDAVLAFRADHPDAPIVVALTGTDLYPELSEKSLESLGIADRIIVLQEGALARIPSRYRAKARRIPIGVPTLEIDPSPWVDPERFQVAVVGHLRAVKDPLRAASASRLAPEDSRLSIRHAGAILDDELSAAVSSEQKTNPRYRWLGILSREESRALITASDLFVLSSFAEEDRACSGRLSWPERP